jgi:hypothetical protein
MKSDIYYRLYGCNPWTDTAQGACASFEVFRRQPVNFFLYHFPGMRRPVSELLAKKIFCILDDPSDDSPRMNAREFGAWAKDLPSLLCKPAIHANPPQVVLLSHSSEQDFSSLSTVVNFDVEERATLIEGQDGQEVYEADTELYAEGMSSRSAFIPRYRKRGSRKLKVPASIDRSADNSKWCSASTTSSDRSSNSVANFDVKPRDTFIEGQGGQEVCVNQEADMELYTEGMSS